MKSLILTLICLSGLSVQGQVLTCKYDEKAILKASCR